MAYISERKFRKDGTPYYEVTVHVGHSTPTVKRRFTPGQAWSAKYTRRELEKFAHELEESVRSGETMTKSQRRQKELEEQAELAKNPTVERYVEETFMPSIRVRCSPNTIAGYESMLKIWIIPALGQTRMEDVSPKMINALLVDMQGKGKSHSTVVKVYNLVNSIFSAAEMDDTIRLSPMHKVRRPKPCKDKENYDGIQAYTAEQVLRVLKALDSEELVWKVYITLMALTGIRRGECTGLRWQDIDMKNGLIKVNGSLNYTPKTGIYYSKTKSGRSRTLQIDQYMVSLLKRYKSSQPVLSEYVFTMPDGCVMHPQSPTRFFKTFGDKYGFPNFHPHLLRHSFATISLTAGADVVSVSQVLGHADPAVTLRVYSHANQDNMNKVSDVFLQAIEEMSSEAK